MFEKDKREENIESPKKDKKNFDLYFKEIKITHNLSSPKIDIKCEHQINNLFASPIPKKIQIYENECINKSYDKNNNIKNESNIYSPYVKRIDINGNKPDIKKENPFPNYSYTSYKKVQKNFIPPVLT